MNLMMFPRMLVSRHEGWDWLMRIPASVARIYLGYVVPISLIPPAMLLYAWSTYGEGRLPEITQTQAMRIAAVLYLTQLIIVPLMAAAIQRIGDVIDARPSYRDAFAFAVAVPTPLWLAPLLLFIPIALVNVIGVMLALTAAGVLIFEGVYRVFKIEDEGHGLLAGGTILAAGLVAWVSMLGIVFVSWSILLT